MEPAAELHPDPILVVRKDLKAAASLLTPTEARYLVDLYYQIQDFRKTTANQIRQIGDSEPTFLIGWVFGNMETTEVEIKKALDVYTTHETTGMGKWAKGVMGIGPVISAGLLAHIDIAKCRTVGSIWRFAGLDPTSKWEKGKKRPWNARLKTLCWLMGQSFEKVSNKEDSLYGKLYKERKAKEWARNVAGGSTGRAPRGYWRPRTSTRRRRLISGCPVGYRKVRCRRYWTRATRRSFPRSRQRKRRTACPCCHLDISARGHADGRSRYSYATGSRRRTGGITERNRQSFTRLPCLTTRTRSSRRTRFNTVLERARNDDFTHEPSEPNLEILQKMRASHST